MSFYMIKPLALCIGLRYTRAKRRNHFISFISLFSMLGIALGVMVLITVLSVMNGFDEQIKQRIFALVPQLTVNDPDHIDAIEVAKLTNKIKTMPNVVAVAPFINGQGMLSNAGQSAGAYVTGILPTQENQVSAIESKMVDGSLANLRAGTFGIILGADLAMHLGVMLGDKITLIIPTANMTPVGIEPRFKRFQVVGIFRIGGGFNFDTNAAFINLSDAQKLWQCGENIDGLRVKVTDLYVAPWLSAELNKILPTRYAISDWTQEYGALFKAIKMEKTMIFILLLFIIAVAAFNLVSGLVMAVNDKRADIAILLTLGASPKTILQIFLVQGTMIGFAGTLLGVFGGIFLALHVGECVHFIEQLFRVHFISANIYFIDYLPSRLEWQDVLKITTATMLMSFVATMYPAWRAAKTDPVEALRYE